MIIRILMGLQGVLQNIVVFYVCRTIAPLHSTMKQKNGRRHYETKFICNWSEKYPTHPVAVR